MEEQRTPPKLKHIESSKYGDSYSFRCQARGDLAPTGLFTSACWDSPYSISSEQSWPIRVYLLGRFSITANGNPIKFGRKAPHRPLAMLKAIISLGSRGVSASRLGSELWPDADGDTAKRCFDTNLHRLRKLIGDIPAIILNDGNVSLDSSVCWVDVWEFERLSGIVQKLLMHHATKTDVAQMRSLMESIFKLYQGHFLGKEEPTPWSISTQERLRNKYISYLLNIGKYWEYAGFPGTALLCYRKGIEIDDIIEVFYQRILVCCLRMGKLSEGMAAYRQCTQILSIVLGLKPQPKTVELYNALRSSQPQLQSA